VVWANSLDLGACTGATMNKWLVAIFIMAMIAALVCIDVTLPAASLSCEGQILIK
jgi:hypothetical protein